MKEENKKHLAKIRGENVNDIYTTDIHSYTIYSTPSHGFLFIGKNDINYSIAKKIIGNTSFGYKNKNGIFLEEDCDAPLFLRTIKVM